MAQNPKYDNDMVNLGYLNKRLGQTEESISKNNNSISQLPKNYSTPPNPPYYKDSLLCYGNKIYRCNITKLRGEFSWNDWTIVATDDTTISDFIKNTYEVEKLEIQEQIDGKVQTHYQDNDPSKDWATDLEKGRHVGDYWYNTTNDTQWRYNQITTGPTITYGWGQVNIPKSVFDTIDRKKSIYTEKPTSYKKDDLWIIEETLSDDDLPIGTDENPIAKGDWVFSIADSDVYNKSHWVKRDEDVPLSYLKQHYYTITEIDSSLEVIERNTESKITKASEEISLNVSQTYTTKEEHVSAINDFDEQIGTINRTITEHKETLSDLSVEVGEISASVETVETKTEELTVDVNGVKENIIPTATITGPSIKVEDASNNSLINLEIEGKSTQAARSGKNKANYKNISNGPSTTVSIIENGFKVNGSYAGILTVENLKVNTDYYLQYVTENIVGTTKMVVLFPSGQQSGSLKSFLNGTGGTFNTGSNTAIDIWFYSGTGSSGEVNFTNIQLEQGKVATKYEKYGVSPSPDYPSEIKSIGYHNEFDSERWYEILRAAREQSMMKETVNGIEYYKFLPHTIYNIEWNAGEFKENTQYTLSFKGLKYIASNPTATGFSFDYTDGTWDYVAISSETEQEYYLTSKPGKTIKYIGLYYSQGYYALVRDIQVVEGIDAKEYIPYGKYGIEVETHARNIWNEQWELGGLNTSTGDKTTSSSYFRNKKVLIVNPNTQYYFKFADIYLWCWYDENMKFISGSSTGTLESVKTSPSNARYLIFSQRGTSYNNNIIINESDDKNGEYESYKGNSILMVLNEPLRSLSNGVKDIAYIRNNRLYVDRYVDSIVVDGSESWGAATALHDGYMRFSYNAPAIKGQNRALSNYFKIGDTSSTTVENLLEYRDTNVIFINTNVAQSLSDFKTWLSTHNTQVAYELAEPYTEEIGEIEMLKTLKGYNNISTTDNLLPIINLTYVRDTILADYVENHVTELKITEGEIKESVEKVSTSVDGLNSTVNRVEEITTDNSQVINVISKNIITEGDKAGTVTEVTTTTGFTFNKDGMTINDGSGFKAEHRADGTYYKDGESIVGEYTKDGSKQKDLSLFGTYSYAMNDKDATPMFIGQLFTNANGEEGFGHFYNGGDY